MNSDAKKYLGLSRAKSINEKNFKTVESSIGIKSNYSQRRSHARAKSNQKSAIRKS